MPSLSGKIEIAANILIILVALLLGAVITLRYMFPSQPNSSQQTQQMLIGSQLPLSDVSWNESNKTLVMVLSTTCRFCIESAEFYQRLSRLKASGKDIRLLAVLPQPVDESSKFLAERNIFVDSIHNANLRDLRVSGTPTLILLDRDGKVVDSWVGKLPSEKENEILLAVFDNPAEM